MKMIKIGRATYNAEILEWKKEDVIAAFSAKYPKGHEHAGKPKHNAEAIWKAIQNYKKNN